MTVTVEKLCAMLSVAYLELTNEKRLQQEIATRLADQKVEYYKEVKCAGGVIDFLIGDIGVEVKIKGARRAIYSQLAGYADDERITHLLLLTSLACPMPTEINGVPCTVLSIGGNWL